MATEPTATVITTVMASSSSRVVTAEVYSKLYVKMTESRGERSKARSEQKDAKERELMIQRQKEEEDHLAKEKEADKQRKVVERALLEEEEKSQEEILRKMHGHEEKKRCKEQEAKDAKAAAKEA